MKISTTVQAGSLESSDILITLVPPEKEGIIINLKSDIEEQFGEAIRLKIEETLKKLGVKNVICYAEDNGALDYAIEARIEAAVFKAKKDGGEE